ncbi:MAG: hypothetical protein Q8918_10650 [Bacteroidota bacterium]|nr:hypothetical protein [Bacteroidota bacterium]MDP4213533.1 hypothetical protein [Bacteroidota bacterium]MDP4250556.1 hypothetical protein [Bacteroidota bacterium]
MKLTSITRYVFIGVLFPLLIQFIMYYRFTPNYQPGVFSEAGFRSFYGSSVFKYRIAGTRLQLWLYRRLKSDKTRIPVKENKIYEKRLLALDEQADDLFYLTYYLINAFFSVLLALCLLFLFDRQHLFTLTEPDKSFAVVLVLLMVAVSQFVVTPYDTASYFFEVFSFTVFLKYFRTNNHLYLLATCLLIMSASFFRESSALILSLMAAVYFLVHGLTPQWVRKMIMPCLSFIIVYAGLRIFAPRSAVQISESSKLVENFTLRPSALMGILMAMIIFYLMLNAASSKDNRRLVRIFLLFTLPYGVMVIFAGLLVEFRLWVPLVIGTAMLYKLNLEPLRNHNYLRDLSANHTTDPQPH